MNETIGKLSLRILQELGQCPTAPFYEDSVSSYIQDFIRRLNLQHRMDAYGNILIHIVGKDPEIPPIAFVAHMDHPGFEAITTTNHREALVLPLGGIPKICFAQASTPTLVLDVDGQWIPSLVFKANSHSDDQTLYLALDDSAKLSFPTPLVLDIPNFSQSDSVVSMRACDDLAGCAIILALMEHLIETKPPGDVFGIFTRAEEVGLTGASLLAESQILPANCFVISVESSKELPGASMHQGPVIRVGDAASTFTFGAEQILRTASQELMAENQSFQIQRQLMSGGTCEATAFIAYGYRAGGLAFPLANYHNSTPSNQIGSESISINDLSNAAQLIFRSSHLMSKNLSFPTFDRFREASGAHRERLMNTRNRLVSSSNRM